MIRRLSVKSIFLFFCFISKFYCFAALNSILLLPFVKFETYIFPSISKFIKSRLTSARPMSLNSSVTNSSKSESGIAPFLFRTSKIKLSTGRVFQVLDAKFYALQSCNWCCRFLRYTYLTHEALIPILHVRRDTWTNFLHCSSEICECNFFGADVFS